MMEEQKEGERFLRGLLLIMALLFLCFAIGINAVLAVIGWVN